MDAHQIANFLSQPGIQNILARVTGGDPSVINGLLRVTGGNSNLYLMNPAGILFEPTARLDIPASLVATTAAAVQFKSGVFAAVGQPDYGAIAGAPLGLAFAPGQPGAIVNAG
ncbi:two-partner secretion domain-containing protein, partial [Trichothermofontia sp.]